MRKFWITVSALVFGAFLIACSGDPGPSKPIGQGQPNTAASAQTQVEPAKESYATPTPKDFTLTIKTLTKECFGSAGCIVEFRVQLKQVSAAKFDPNKTYELTYEIKGGEDPKTNTMTITGDQYSTDEKENIDTPSKNSVLKAVITSIEEQ